MSGRDASRRYESIKTSSVLCAPLWLIAARDLQSRAEELRICNPQLKKGTIPIAIWIRAATSQ